MPRFFNFPFFARAGAWVCLWAAGAYANPWGASSDAPQATPPAPAIFCATLSAGQAADAAARKIAILEAKRGGFAKDAARVRVCDNAGTPLYDSADDAVYQDWCALRARSRALAKQNWEALSAQENNALQCVARGVGLNERIFSEGCFCYGRHIAPQWGAVPHLANAAGLYEAARCLADLSPFTDDALVLTHLYLKGWGVAKDAAAAFRVAEAASLPLSHDFENVPAYAWLAIAYECGIGTPKDTDLAAYYWNKFYAAKGHDAAFAQIDTLKRMYAGFAFAQDKTRPVAMLEKLARNAVERCRVAREKAASANNQTPLSPAEDIARVSDEGAAEMLTKCYLALASGALDANYIDTERMHRARALADALVVLKQMPVQPSAAAHAR